MPQTQQILKPNSSSTLPYPQDAPPSTWVHKPGTWGLLCSSLSLTSHIQSVSKLCWLDRSICRLLQFIVIVLVEDRGSSSFSRTTASQVLYLPLVLFLSKPFSTSFHHGPSKVWLDPVIPLSEIHWGFPIASGSGSQSVDPLFLLHRITPSTV